MTEKQPPGVPPAFDDSAERAMWAALAGVETEEPSPHLRQSFYRRLELATRRTWFETVRDALGLRGYAGWLTAAACLLVGLGTGQLTAGGNVDAGIRLAALEENVTALNRRLILDRLESNTPGKRLRGVIDAAGIAGDDDEIARALLVRASGDRVPSVRSAAIDALGPRIDAPAVATQVMNLLQQAESPIVQLALVDLVLRYGNDEQLGQLLALAEDGRLHPDLKRHVLASLKRETA